MNPKIENLKDMEYFGNMELLGALVLSALKKKKTDKLEQMSRAITEIAFYVSNLQTDRKMYNRSMSEFRLEKNRAILRARKAEKENEDLKIIVKKYEQFVR
jgi:hypothetical protein